MFISVSPTFSATSTKEGNPSSAPSRKDVPRTNGSQRNFTISSPSSRLDFSEQLLVLAVFFVEYDCTLRCLQSIGKLADFQISRAETRPASGVERICFNGAFQDVGSVFRRSAIEK